MLACVLIDPVVYCEINMYIFKYSNRAFISLNEKHIYYELENVVTDHKPLITLLGPKKGIPSLAAARLQRWAIIYTCTMLSLDQQENTVM